ncbi:MAG: DUF4198 domain-containing protein [Gammaproteobacteria bacterium]|uniref:DUF6795 domain-containing protein n=1 Tax=Limnobacter sp. TaxID=2003368 RepID=UPI001D77D809|nr:DUF4198 domain-containing protein [Gammaproteobacteria bacterium]MBU0848443.1 DUF4198 domain-containing protein [Gammaproteobacteria bacterium]MBU1267420.1 DUF4198 domain-containing protein [Gammaproteobacteria bacterium]MBU1530445.1 DUF4198 domain-containing protein [Gammaproteobacteria bacterium]MBU1780348.1 DUF4198 domain-containing protein [Gammaproteobacteria bacterium]
MWQDNLILSSAVEGQILDHGKPVAGQKVIRTLHWNMEAEPRTETTTTNKDGRFQFPEVRGAAEFGFLAKLFHVPTVSIRVYVPVKEREYMAYATSRNSYKANAETGLPLIRLKCDLKNQEMFNGRLPIINCEVEESEERKNLKYD